MQRRLCFEFGVHVLELVRYFFDSDPVRIFCHIPTPRDVRNPEPVNIISVEFSDGRAASIVLDRLSKGPERYLEMRLDGEHASIHTSIGGEVRLEVGMHTRERRPFIGFKFIKGGKAVLQNGNRSKLIGKDGLNPLSSATGAHMMNLLEAIQTGSLPPCTAGDHRKTLALVLAAYDSAESGKPIEMKRYLKNVDVLSQ